MTVVTGLIPARFLTMIAHLVITITLFWTMDESVAACLPIDYSPDDFKQKRTEIIVALILMIVFVVVELVGLMFGISMFIHLQGLLSTCCHTSGAVSTAFFMFESWPCYLYWYIWGFCSVLPFVTELAVFVFVFVIRRTLL